MGPSDDILLCDLDAFFASVEQRDCPEYRGKPVIVGGQAETRGVVAACSYEARAFGIHSAMPVARALRLCPQVVLLPVDIPRYRRVSDEVTEIYGRFTPIMEEVSIDEAYLAVPASKGSMIASQIRQTVRREVGLPLSIGISENKLLAKVASKMAKPDGQKELWPEDVPELLWSKDISWLPGVGPKTRKRLNDIGIRTVGDLAARDEEVIAAILGTFGRVLHRYAHGKDDREVCAREETKSISEETTFPQDISNYEEALAVLMLLSEEVGFRLRQKGYKARTISVKIRFSSFVTTTRSITLSEGTCTDSSIYEAVKDLFNRYGEHGPWRLLGVQVSTLIGEEYRQIPLIGAPQDEEREEKVAAVVDELKTRYGRNIIRRARVLVRGK